MKYFPRSSRFSLLTVVISGLTMTAISFASFEDMPVGARVNSLAGAYVGLADDPETIFVNPSGLTQIETISSSLFYSRPFGLKELSHGCLTTAIPFFPIAIGLAFQTFGNQVYRENSFVTAVAHRFHRNLSFGFSLRYEGVSIQKYGDAATLAFDAGLLLHLSPRWQIGFCTKNLHQSYIGEDDEKLPQSFQIGWSFKLSEKFRFSSDLYKDIRFPMDVRGGLELCPLDNLQARIGFGTEPSRFAAGIGLSFSKFRWDYGFYTHSDLGFTHQISILFFLGH